MVFATLEAAIKKSHANLESALSWENWKPKHYLQTYFAKLGQDSIANLRFLVRELQTFEGKPRQKILDFGAGPTVFAGLIAAPYASEFHMADYIYPNLTEIRLWFEDNVNAFNWDDCTKVILEMEGNVATTQAIEERKKMLRETRHRLLFCDASSEEPLGGLGRQKYPLVIMNFCVDSATSSKKTWNEYMNNVLSLVEENGTILVSALRNCSLYKCGNDFFPSANINEKDLTDSLLINGFHIQNNAIEVHDVPECESEGFTSVMFARAIKAPLYSRLRSYFDSQIFDNEM